MGDVTVAVIVAAIGVFSSGGAAWAGVRSSLNGTRERVARIETKVDNLGSRLAYMEGKASNT
jgi:hypothetical protein